MKKVLKLLFSRFTLIVLAIVLQMLLYIVFPFVLSERFPLVPINAIISVIALIVVLFIINSDIIIEGQLPLIILCITFPVVGIAFCALFLKIKVPRKVKKFAESTFVESKKYITRDADYKDNLEKTAGDFGGVVNYITNITGQKAYFNTDCKFFDSGEKFFESLKNDLKSAKKYIFLEYFIIDNGKMWNEIHEILLEKVKAGVEVRVMYDDLGTISKLKSNFAKKLNREGIICKKFNEYSSMTSSVYNNRDHRKITVVDGNVGYMGGANIADEYINEIHPYGHWKDSAIRLEGDAVTSLVCMFLQLFDIQSKRTEDYGKYILDAEKKSKGLVCPFGDGPKYFYGDNTAENVFLNAIGGAKKYVYITTPYLIIDSKLKSALINASLRGVDVKIITPHIPDKKSVFRITRSSYKDLQKKGVKILEYKEGFIHSKQMLIDDSFALVGTINLDYRSMIHHYECGAIMIGTQCIDSIKADFENIQKTAIDMKDYKQRVFTKVFCALIKLFTPLF